MKKLIALATGFLMSFSVMADDLITSDDPHDLLEQVANKTFERIGNERAKIDEDLDYLRVIVREEMMPYVDYQYAANKTLGRNYKNTSREERIEYHRVFRDYLIATYARAFLQYDEEIHTVEFEPPRGEADRSAVVRTRVIEEGRPPIRLDFRMRFDNNDNVWKAYDLIVEGISLLDSKQAEIAAVIRSRGIDGTIALLREKADEEIKSDDDVDVPE
ncbi:organic solvent ABC transporter [Thalassospira xiamenensis]|nr:organic solvent ABC transporter [Thalassospira xiamenensis]